MWIGGKLFFNPIFHFWDKK